LYPEEMGPKAMDVVEFLANSLPQLDSQIAQRVKKAASNGNVLRYACMIEGSRYYFTPWPQAAHYHGLERPNNQMLIGIALLVV